ncbi:MAG: hypothetical protein HUJ27_00940 [Rhodobacteraceae bacterium]|nr:hypothetical protein [Paracoccaceae bacterium]
MARATVWKAGLVISVFREKAAVQEARPVLVVVYQFGKVASTALTEALNGAPGIRAVQSHFLGEDALKKMLPLLLNGEDSDHFYRHRMGQFQANLELTRQINAIRAGRSPERLVILSLSREPWGWFRSALLQDFAGHLPVLRALAVDRLEDLSLGLQRFFDLSADIIAERGGIDPLLDDIRAGRFHLPNHVGHAGFGQLFFTLIRPFGWFQDHFEKATGLGLEGFQPQGAVWRAERPRMTCLVVRYEDLGSALGPALHGIGLPELSLPRRNVGAAKPDAERLGAAFAACNGDVLRTAFRATRYARFFGYDQPGG